MPSNVDNAQQMLFLARQNGVSDEERNQYIRAGEAYALLAHAEALEDHANALHRQADGAEE
jgi:hypothetical protein